MTLESITSIHSVTIQTLTTTQSSGGGAVRTWANVTTINGRYQPMRGIKILEFRNLGIHVTGNFFFSEDPQIDPENPEEYRILFDGRVFEIHAFRNVDEVDRLWKAQTKEVSQKN